MLEGLRAWLLDEAAIEPDSPDWPETLAAETPSSMTPMSAVGGPEHIPPGASNFRPPPDRNKHGRHERQIAEGEHL